MGHRVHLMIAKMKEQLLCDTVTNCRRWSRQKIGELQQSKVKNSNKLLKYENNKENRETKISGDTCPDLGVADRFGNVWFKELITAGACPECERANSKGETVGSKGTHSKACLNSLWKTPFTNKGIRVQCTTDFDDKYAKIIGDQFANSYKPYYKISSEMKTKLNNEIVKFQKDYMDDPQWDILKKYPRRKYNVKNIDLLWKQCFGEDRKGKVSKENM